jgi:hypothetical protein
MRITLFLLAWAFVGAVAAYDVHFAWRYREVFQEWEMNPVARWATGLWGLGAVAVLKMALLGFALGVAAYCHRRHHRLEVPLTLVVSGAHLVLSVCYLCGQLA